MRPTTPNFFVGLFDPKEFARSTFLEFPSETGGNPQK